MPPSCAASTSSSWTAGMGKETAAPGMIQGAVRTGSVSVRVSINPAMPEPRSPEYYVDSTENELRLYLLSFFSKVCTACFVSPTHESGTSKPSPTYDVVSRVPS